MCATKEFWEMTDLMIPQGRHPACGNLHIKFCIEASCYSHKRQHLMWTGRKPPSLEMPDMLFHACLSCAALSILLQDHVSICALEGKCTHSACCLSQAHTLPWHNESSYIKFAPSGTRLDGKMEKRKTQFWYICTQLWLKILGHTGDKMLEVKINLKA